MKKLSILIIVLAFVLTACSAPSKNNSLNPPDQTGNTTKVESWDSINNETSTLSEETYPRVDGSTSTLNIVQSMYGSLIGWGGANMPERASKTVPSYQKLIAGEVDLIVVPYASAEVLKDASAAGVTLKFYPVAAEALIFITPVENTTENITREQVRSIYLNNGIENWNELNGPNRTLIPICRNSDSGSQSQMDNLVLDKQEMDSRIKNNYVELTMEGMLEQVAFYHKGGLSGSPTNSYALGYTLYTYLQNMNRSTGIGEKLNTLSFDGVKPTAETIGDGSYPLTDAYYAVVRSDLEKENSVWSLLSWLKSDQGIAKIEDLGYISCVK